MPALLSVIIPAYNESARLRKTLPRVIEYLNDNFPNSELIVVDDGSTDSTSTVAHEGMAQSGSVHGSVISYQSNLGKGRAVRLGLLAARGKIALFSDADL